MKTIKWKKNESFFRADLDVCLRKNFRKDENGREEENIPTSHVEMNEKGNQQHCNE